MPKFKIIKSFVAKNGRIVFGLKGQTVPFSISADLAHRFLSDFIGTKAMYRVDAKLLKGSSIECESAKVLPVGHKWTNEETGETGELTSERLELETWVLNLNEDKVLSALIKFKPIRKDSGKIDSTAKVAVVNENQESDDKDDKKAATAKKSAKASENEVSDKLPA